LNFAFLRSLYNRFILIRWHLESLYLDFVLLFAFLFLSLTMLVAQLGTLLVLGLLLLASCIVLRRLGMLTEQILLVFLGASLLTLILLTL
jgi:hypothetical protein